MKNIFKPVVLSALLLTSSISFSQSDNSDGDVIFDPPTGVEESHISDNAVLALDFNVTFSEANLEIGVLTSSTLTCDFALYNILGKTVFVDKIIPQGEKTKFICPGGNFEKGLYIISVRQGKDTVSKKVFIGSKFI